MILSLEESNKIQYRVRNLFSKINDFYDFMWINKADYEPIDYLDELWNLDDIYDIKYGSSKAVLFCNFLDEYVLKIPFLGEMVLGVKCERFKNADISHNSWDYCEAEAKIYKSACEDGISNLFCGIELLCQINNFPVYIAEKCTSTLDENFDLYNSSEDGIRYARAKSEKNKDKFLVRKPGDMEEEVVGLFYDSWGEKNTDKLLDFLVDNDVSDCHNGNVGFKDGKIRLIDYSGFYV